MITGSDVYIYPLSAFHETEDGFFAEASDLQFRVGIWPKLIVIEGRAFIRSSYDSEAAIYRCEDGDQPEVVEVFND